MKWLFCEIVLFAIICIPVVSSRGAEKSKLTWDSPRVLEVKKDYELLVGSFTEPSTKSNGGERMTKIGDLLKKRLSHREMSELAATCDTLPVAVKDWTDFELSLMLEMTWVFLKDADRDSLVTLFSNRFPQCYDFPDIEDLLVLHGAKLKDPVLILGDAYSKCRVPEVRLQIAQAIRRGFKGSGIRGNDDADFIKNAMQWYQREKDSLAYNPEYGYNRDAPGSGGQYIRHPLFRRKSSAAESRHEEEKGNRNQSPPTNQVKPLKTTMNSIGMKMVLIPAGEFTMGAPDDEIHGVEGDDFPPHRVRITKPFWFGAYEVTQMEYENITGKNPSLFSPKGGLSMDVVGLDTKRFPVEHVSWYEAVEFCNRLSKKEGLPEYYRLSEAWPEEDYRTVKVVGGHGYRLPTEAEWEYACRAGTSTPFSFGAVLKANQAHVSGKIRLKHPAPVGSYPPNAFGLHDMHGNVAEFCNDGYDRYYYEDCPIDDPPGSSDRHWVAIRGGYWSGGAESADSAGRFGVSPGEGLMFVGFRVAKGPEPVAPRSSDSPHRDPRP